MQNLLWKLVMFRIHKKLTYELIHEEKFIAVATRYKHHYLIVPHILYIFVQNRHGIPQK